MEQFLLCFREEEKDNGNKIAGFFSSVMQTCVAIGTYYQVMKWSCVHSREHTVSASKPENNTEILPIITVQS